MANTSRISRIQGYGRRTGFRDQTTGEHWRSGGQSRSSSGRQRKGVFWVDIDVSSLRERMAGISASRLMELPEFRKMSLHYGLEAKEVAVNATKRALKTDPREAWRAVSLGYSDKRGAPVLFLGINESRNVDKRPWNPKRKGTRGQRTISAETRTRNSYWGRSRAFILRFVNSGTEQRFTKRRGRWNRGATAYGYKKLSEGKAANRGSIKGRKFFYSKARRALIAVSQDWLVATNQLVAKEFNRR